MEHNYEKFASVYDAVMDDSLYDLWTDFSLRHLPKSKGRNRLLELACGTGIQSVRFAQAGFDVTGLDLSQDMLAIAKKRAQSAKKKIDFIQGNMLDLSQVGQFDFVTCYSDSICYMQDEVDVGDVFKEVYDVLANDGIFIFDVHSTYQTDECFLVIPIMRMQMILQWFGIPMLTRLLTLLFTNSLSLSKKTMDVFLALMKCMRNERMSY